MRKIGMRWVSLQIVEMVYSFISGLGCGANPASPSLCGLPFRLPRIPIHANHGDAMTIRLISTTVPIWFFATGVKQWKNPNDHFGE